jgi:hypothetical protein
MELGRIYLYLTLKSEEGDRLGDLGVFRRIIVKWILKK